MSSTFQRIIKRIREMLSSEKLEKYIYRLEGIFRPLPPYENYKGLLLAFEQARIKQLLSAEGETNLQELRKKYGIAKSCYKETQDISTKSAIRDKMDVLLNKISDA